MAELGKILDTHVVKAREPTLLGTHSHWELSANDLLHGFPVDTAYIVPTPSIDLDRFNEALSKTLSVFPLAAGRLEHPPNSNSPWRVRLSNTGVPVTIYESQSATVFQTNSVVQGPTLSIAERVDVKTIYSPRCNEVPLAKITIISFPRIGCTSLGVSIAHVIGDGYNSYQFARFLSQYYQGLPLLDDLPSYAPPPLYPRSERFQDLWIPTIDHPFHKSVVPPFMDPTCEKSIRLTFRLLSGQLGELQRAVTDSRESTDTREVLSLSRQDTIGAVLARCFTKADSKNAPVEHVSTCFMCRGAGPCPKTSPTNGVMFTLAEPIDNPSNPSLYDIASRIRRSIFLARDPEFVSSVMSIVQETYNTLSAEEKIVDLTPEPGHLLINSTWKFNWHSSHFGYANQTRFFHTLMTVPRFIKIFQPNPCLLPDAGTWKSFTQDDAEISVCVPLAVRNQFEQVLRDELNGLGVSGDIEILWSE